MAIGTDDQQSNQKMDEDVPSVQEKKDKLVKGGKSLKDDKKDDDLSEEDRQLKESLELLVERIQDPEPGIQKLAIESMRQEIRTATSSMTSVPKPLKFLRSHYGTLKACYDTIATDNKVLLADVISVLAMTMSEDGARESLKYRLLGSVGDIGSWGHEYVRNLAGEVSEEYQLRDFEEKVTDLMEIVTQIVPFHIKHNAEPEAVDLLLEVESLELLVEQIDATNYKRTCLYLTSCASFVPDPEDEVVLSVAYQIYMKHKDYSNAIRVALQSDSEESIKEAFNAATGLEKKQLCYILGRQGYPLDLEENSELCSDEEREELMELINNLKLTEGYMSLARDLDVMEPKLPEDIYKNHLVDGRATSQLSMDSARQNLAATFVNGLVNAGFGQDKLVTDSSDSASSGSWLYKNKDHAKISVAASLGLVLLWDVDGGLSQIDKYLYSPDPNVVAGSLLAIGIVSTGIRSECDPVFALLCDSVEKSDPTIKIGAIMGLGLAYAGSQKEQVLELLSPVLTDAAQPLEVVAFAAVSLALVYVGTHDEEIAQTILTVMMERSAQLTDPVARFLPLGLALLYMGKKELVEATLEVAKTLSPEINCFCDAVLESFAYAGTGNVLKVQEFLSECGEHLEGKDDLHQGASVIGIAMVAMGDELGSEMACRSLMHLLQYGDPNVRRAVPLALALLSVSSPKITIMDTLSRLSHDNDSEVAMGAILALGLIGAGTNNARIAGMLRNLSSYYYKDPGALFFVRLAQGLTHLGKGLLTLNPYHSDRFLLSKPALAGLSVFLYTCLDVKSSILGPYHFVTYFLVTAIKPRMLLTVDEDLKPLSVNVRVGQAVDIAGQAGRPKTITGFQTHTTPVLLSAGDRAELATNKYIPLTSILEGFVILKPNPEFVEDHLGS